MTTAPGATQEPLATAAAAPAAHSDGAVKVYGHGGAAVRAVDGITLQLAKSRFTAIMGPSGSGKSTLLHCMAGLDRLTEGRTYIGGVELGGLSDKELTLLRRAKVGFIFQTFNLVPTLSAIDNIVLPLTIAGRKPEQAALDEVVRITGLGDRLSHRPAELSGGQQQRVAAAGALVSRPEIIFADEPTGNLDSRASSEILTFMRNAVRDLGQTIVMVTHDPAAAAYASRVLFLADGRIVDELPSPTAEAVLDRLKAMGS